MTQLTDSSSPEPGEVDDPSLGVQLDEDPGDEDFDGDEPTQVNDDEEVE